MAQPGGPGRAPNDMRLHATARIRAADGAGQHSAERIVLASGGPAAGAIPAGRGRVAD